MVLAAVVAKEQATPGYDYFPLQVEYREKAASAGKIPGGFFKREARPTEKEVLSSRVIDRPIRPLFPEWFQCETQVIVTVYSSDQEHDGDVLGAVAASAALMISDIPFAGPVAEVRVGRINGQLVINPTFTDLQTSDMDIIVAGTEDSIVMVEGEAREMSEEDMLAALEFAESRDRARDQLVLAAILGVALAFAWAALCAWVVVALWDTYRLLALGAIVVFHLVVAAVAWLRLRSAQATSSAPFAQTLAELDRDRQWLAEQFRRGP